MGLIAPSSLRLSVVSSRPWPNEAYVCVSLQLRPRLTNVFLRSNHQRREADVWVANFAYRDAGCRSRRSSIGRIRTGTVSESRPSVTVLFLARLRGLGPVRMVPGRRGMTYTEKDWLTMTRLHTDGQRSKTPSHGPVCSGTLAQTTLIMREASIRNNFADHSLIFLLPKRGYVEDWPQEQPH